MSPQPVQSEKYVGAVDTHRAVVDEHAEALNGYVTDPTKYADNAAGLKTSKDGRYILIPQPSDSPNDPLNWSQRRKWQIIAIVAYIAFLADYTGGTAIITVLPQAAHVHIPFPQCQNANESVENGTKVKPLYKEL